MAKTQIEAMRESVHAVRVYSGKVEEILRCRRCDRLLSEAQFQPLFGTKYRRDVRGVAGAGRAMVHYLHPWCYTCKKQSAGQHVSHPLYSPEIDRYWQKRIQGIRSGADDRGLLVLVDKDDLLGICLQQQNLCAITGMPMTFNTKDVKNKRLQASVDRIDSRGNYAINNIQIVCNVVNLMKSDMSMTEFRQWCSRALIGRRKLEEDLLSAIDGNPS